MTASHRVVSGRGWCRLRVFVCVPLSWGEASGWGTLAARSMVVCGSASGLVVGVGCWWRLGGTDERHAGRSGVQ